MDAVLIKTYLLSIIICPCIAFYYTKKRFLTNNLKKLKAVLLFFIISLIPVFSYIVILVLLIAVEEIFKKSIVSELMGRSFLFSLAAGIIVSLIAVIVFAAYTASYRTKSVI